MSYLTYLHTYSQMTRINTKIHRMIMQMWENVNFGGIWVKDTQEVLILSLQLFRKSKIISNDKSLFCS